MEDAFWWQYYYTSGIKEEFTDAWSDSGKSFRLMDA